MRKGPWRRNNHIRSWSWNGFEKYKVKIDVYGLGESAELFLNGKSLGKKRIKKGIAEFHTKYIPGTLYAKVYNSDGSNR